MNFRTILGGLAVAAIAALAVGADADAGAKAKTTAKITYIGGTDGGFAVIGKVGSHKKGCRDHRKVKIKLNGSIVASTRSQDGYFSVDYDAKPGDYTAVAKATRGCRKATSKAYHYSAMP
jgi:predicted lipoprotein